MSSDLVDLVGDIILAGIVLSGVALVVIAGYMVYLQNKWRK